MNCWVDGWLDEYSGEDSGGIFLARKTDETLAEDKDGDSTGVESQD